MFGTCARAQTAIPAQPVTSTVQNNTPLVTEYTLPPKKLSKSYALYQIRGWVIVLSTIYSFLVLLFFIQWRWAVRLRDWAERRSTRRFVQAVIVVPLFAISFSILRLPFAIYGHHIGLKYGLSVQGWDSWLRDWAVQLGLVVVVGTIVIWIFYVVAARSPLRWWLYFWLAIIPISAFLTIIAPVAIDPLFYESKPLSSKHPELVDALERVSRNGGLDIPRDRMYEMKASSKLTGPNAYVTGFGATKRVVVWDTAIQQFTDSELMLVYGHEMGHYILGHVVRGFIVAMVFLLALLFITFYLGRWIQTRWGERWGIRGLHDWASLPLLILIASVLAFVSEPALNAEPPDRA